MSKSIHALDTSKIRQKYKKVSIMITKKVAKEPILKKAQTTGKVFKLQNRVLISKYD